MLLSIVLAGRWLIAAALVEWSTATSRSIKGFWRRRLIAHLRQPRAEGERSRGDLSLAIDHASDGPWLELLATSARVSVLGLGVVFWAVGWLSTLITLALMGLAVPLYQRAGRRSEALAQDYQQRRALLETRQLELLNHAPNCVRSVQSPTVRMRSRRSRRPSTPSRCARYASRWSPRSSPSSSVA